jgi:hypothetical protein
MAHNDHSKRAYRQLSLAGTHRHALKHAPWIVSSPGWRKTEEKH